MEKWIVASVKASKYETFMMMTVQGLGTLDLQLLNENSHFVSRFSSEKENIDFALALTKHNTLAYLWVLGAYEILRSIAQRETNQPQKFKEAKAKFERIRIPLAKYEPAKKHAATDSAIAYPTFDYSLGVGWLVNNSTNITRTELSKYFLEGLESL